MEGVGSDDWEDVFELYRAKSKEFEVAFEKAEKWDKAYSGVYDDEMPFTPERISLVMNFVNDHFPDFDTPKEFEDMITEYIDWETELTEAEDKLEAIKDYRRLLFSQPKGTMMETQTIAKILKKLMESSYFTTNSEEGEE